MTKLSPWAEDGALYTDAGQYGGDVQVGEAYFRRFVHTLLPGRVVDIAAYPIEAEGPGDDEKSITLECQQMMTVFADGDDPGGTEVWSDVTYVDLPERFDRTYTSVSHAESAARALVVSMEPHHIGWDGAPGVTEEPGSGGVDTDDRPRTLGDLSVRELIELAMTELREVMSALPDDEKPQLGGVYAYLSLAKDKIDSL